MKKIIKIYGSIEIYVMKKLKMYASRLIERYCSSVKLEKGREHDFNFTEKQIDDFSKKVIEQWRLFNEQCRKWTDEDNEEN